MSESLPDCPACSGELSEPGVCVSCGPLKLFKVEQPRVRHVVYCRDVWASDAEAAIRIAEAGTAWPETYDEQTTSLQEGAYTAVEEQNALKYAVRKHRVGFDVTDE